MIIITFGSLLITTCMPSQFLSSMYNFECPLCDKAILYQLLLKTGYICKNSSKVHLALVYIRSAS